MQRRNRLRGGTLLLLLGIGVMGWLLRRMWPVLLLDHATRITSTADWMHGNRLGGWIACFWTSPHTFLFFREALNPTVDDADFGFHARMFRYDVNTRTETFLSAATRRFHTLHAYPGDYMQVSPHGDWLLWYGITSLTAYGVKLDGSRTFALEAPPDIGSGIDGEEIDFLPDGKRWMEKVTKPGKTPYMRLHAFDVPATVQELPLSAPLVRDYLAPRRQFAATKNAEIDRTATRENETFSPQQDRVAWTQTTEQPPQPRLAWLRRLFRLAEQDTMAATTLWVSRPDGRDRHFFGAIDRIDFLCWTPEGTRLSFIHDDTLWTVPAR